MIKELQELLALCVKINEEGKYHVFFNFSGHVNVIDIRVLASSTTYAEGTPQDRLYSDSVYLNLYNAVLELKRTIKDLKKFKG